MIRESTIEKRFRENCEALGCMVRKFSIHSNDPDRLILAPGGKAMFLELKRPGEVPRPGQLKRLEELRALGYPAGWSDNAEDATQWVKNEIHR